MKQLQLTLLNLSVYHQTEEDGDELFLKFNGKRFWPLNERYFSVRTAGKIRLNCYIDIPYSDRTFEFELWEYDNLFSSQRLGTFYLRSDQEGGPFTTDLVVAAGVFAKYSIDWGLSRKFVGMHL